MKRLLIAGGLLVLLVTGCSDPRDDVNWNPYAPNAGETGILRMIETVPDAGEKGLHYLDHRLENWLY